MLNRCPCLFRSLSFPLLLASFFLPLHAQSLSVSFLILFFSNARRFLLSCFRLFYANELVEDDVGEETIAQTSTEEQSGPL